jgi:hypothetical protein
MLIDEQKNIFEEWLSQYERLFYKIVRTYAETQQDSEDLFQQIAGVLGISAKNVGVKLSWFTFRMVYLVSCVLVAWDVLALNKWYGKKNFIPRPKELLQLRDSLQNPTE